MLKDEDMNAQDVEKKCAEKEDECLEKDKNSKAGEKIDLDEKLQESDNENIDEEEKVDEKKSEDEAEVKEEEVDELEEKRKKLQEELKKENFKLKDENNKIMNEFKALQDRLSRTMAEYDNFRKRTSKEKEGIYSDACKDILKEILPVLDNLERAAKSEGNLDALKKGVEMTMKQFNTALEKLNVEEIPSEGEFDPNVHNAVMHIEDDNYDKNCIVEVFQKGYKRGDKIIRYSMVKVAN
ncbi:nucleotide exchange factor GrpE [Clostridium aromativorans]|uniref:nucleotide exchange factor GrpE n=1 Tax=Clostridium aromativorans TaxID=2836848 RepID=UPI00227D706D|nr:nucleotide exchange factor GrpE [Clostridium aromativorans]